MFGPWASPPYREVRTVCLCRRRCGRGAVYPIAKALHEMGNTGDLDYRRRNKEMLILEEEMKAISEL